MDRTFGPRRLGTILILGRCPRLFWDAPLALAFPPLAGLKDAADIVAGVVQAAPPAMADVQARLPKSFPPRVADRILTGLTQSLARLDE